MNEDRRQLLKATLGASVAAALPASAALTTAETAALDKADWSQIRKLFTFRRQAPLNAANLCPTFDSVLIKQQQYAEALNRDVSLLNRRSFNKDKVEGARHQCAAMLGLSNERELAFVRNTSEANAVIVRGLQLGTGDEVLRWEENHATNYQSWHYQHLQQGFQCRSLQLPESIQSTDQIVDSFLRALSPATRVVSFSQLSNISGLLLPAEEICRAVHDRRPDIHIHIDGAQTWGNLPVDLDRIDCDSYTASGHKWLCGPRGTGILAVREQRAEQISPLINAYDFYYDYPEQELQDNALRFENLGQRDTAVYAALGDTVAMHEAIGTERIARRIKTLTQYALGAFDKAGISSITPKEEALHQGVVVVDPGSRWQAYGAFLALHNAGYAAAFVHGNRVHCDPDAVERERNSKVYLRVCPHIYNSRADIDAAVEITSRITQSQLEILREMWRFL